MTGSQRFLPRAHHRPFRLERPFASHGVFVFETTVASVELDPLLLSAQPSTSRNLSPATLLRAEYAAVGFYGRDAEMDQLRAWCGGSRSVDVRLMTGPGRKVRPGWRGSSHGSKRAQAG